MRLNRDLTALFLGVASAAILLLAAVVHAQSTQISRPGPSALRPPPPPSFWLGELNVTNASGQTIYTVQVADLWYSATWSSVTFEVEHLSVPVFASGPGWALSIRGADGKTVAGYTSDSTGQSWETLAATYVVVGESILFTTPISAHLEEDEFVAMTPGHASTGFELP